MRFAENKTVIVTGASRGIGRAVALELARLGARLVLNGRDEARLAAVAGECEKAGGSAVAVAGSIAEESVATEAAAAAFGCGQVYGFIHAAGVLRPGPALWEIYDHDFTAVFEASVVGGWRLIRAVVPGLRAQGNGVAVFFGSGAAEMAIPGIGAYCAAKAAEESIARTLAAEAPEIVSFVYRPGTVDTRMQQQAREAAGSMARGLREKFRRMKDMSELISPEEAARGLVDILKGGQADQGGLEKHRGRIARP